MAKKAERRWVLRDLSNGDGADGRKFPTYVWAFQTRAQARRAQHLHGRTPGFAVLGCLESWPLRTLERLYTPGERGTVAEFYYRRRSDR